MIPSCKLLLKTFHLVVSVSLNFNLKFDVTLRLGSQGFQNILGHSGMGAYHGNKSFECFSHYKSVLQSGTPQFLLKTRSAPYGADVKNAKTFEKLALN